MGASGCLPLGLDIVGLGRGARECSFGSCCGLRKTRGAPDCTGDGFTWCDREDRVDHAFGRAFGLHFRLGLHGNVGRSLV